jgi:hypothetical protein
VLHAHFFPKNQHFQKLTHDLPARMDVFSFARFAHYYPRCCIMFPAKFPRSANSRRVSGSVSSACAAKAAVTGHVRLDAGGLRLLFRLRSAFVIEHTQIARSLFNPTTAAAAPKSPVKLKDRDPIATGQRDAAFNRSASFNYFLSDRFEAGLALRGAEVKSIREG